MKYKFRNFWKKAQYVFWPLLAIALIALYRSLIHQLPYFTALDDVLTALVSNIWKLVSTPTIILAVLVLVFLWPSRNKIIELLGRTESAELPGGFKLNFANILKKIESTTPSEIPLEVGETDLDFLGKLIEKLDNNTLNALYFLNKKAYPTAEWFSQLSCAILSSEQPSKEYRSLNIFYGIGIYSQLHPLNLFTVFQDENTMKITLLPEVQKKIEDKLATVMDEFIKVFSDHLNGAGAKHKIWWDLDVHGNYAVFIDTKKPVHASISQKIEASALKAGYLMSNYIYYGIDPSL